MDVPEMLWQQIEPLVYITREQFMRGLADWEIEPIEINGQIAGAGLTRGSEYHFTSFDTGVSVPRSVMRAQLAPILEKWGCVTTRTPKDGADRQHRFNRAFGFKPTGEDEFFTHYRLDKKCQ